MKKLHCVDLFAGAGGLGYGFLETTKFDIVLAVESNQHAKKTYNENHPSAKILGDINQLKFDNISNELGFIDVVIGGPPCQGFSNANRQRNYLVSPMNQLVKKYIEAVEKLNPNIIVMENVKTINSDKHKFFLTKQNMLEIEKLGIYIVNETIILGYSVDNNRKFIRFLNDYKMNSKITECLLPQQVGIYLNQLFKKSTDNTKFNNYFEKNKTKITKIIREWDIHEENFWHSSHYRAAKRLKAIVVLDNLNSDFKITELLLKKLVETNRTLTRVSDIKRYDIYPNTISFNKEKQIVIQTKSYKIIDYVHSKLKSLGYQIDSGVLNAADFGVPQNRKRFILLGVKENLAKKRVSLPDKIINSPHNYFTIKDAIKDLEKYSPVTTIDPPVVINKRKSHSNQNKLLLELNDSRTLYNHVVTDSRKNALMRFKALKPGQNFHDLSDDLKTTYTEPSKTQNTIYKRLNYNSPSDTVVNVRKSMWIHPTQDRAISIREAARLQSFPDSFIFHGTKDAQYQQIGNAVPPKLGKAIALKIIDLIT